MSKVENDWPCIDKKNIYYVWFLKISKKKNNRNNK